jgi:Protein of unknown function (DUF2946)
MGSLRAFFCNHRNLALCLVLLALCMKVLVPSGFMIGSHAKVLTVEICGDASGSHLTKRISIPMKGDSGPSQNGQGQADSACPYSALSQASLAATDPLLLALSLAFIVALGLLPLAPRQIGRSPYLRPPLRGPPAFA